MFLNADHSRPVGKNRVSASVLYPMALQLLDLLGDGYFPKELPPPFTTAPFANASAGPLPGPPAGAFDSKPHYSMPCVHNLVRTGGLRRNLAIPNPKHFFRLANHVVGNWAQFTACTDVSPFALSKPVTGGSRAISSEHDLSEQTLQRAALRSTNRFLLRTDISRFYPSIYTHSIPWAVMGKAAAKAAYTAHALGGTWQDTADMLSRSINNNQTVGIPIGPDTSHLIAEVLLSHIDVELANKFPRLRGLRYVDDYEFSFATRAEAEDVLSYVQHLLSQFELALNPNKTGIIELPIQLDSTWTSRVRVFPFRKAGVKGQRNDLTAYFDLVFDLFRRYPEEGMSKYAIARLRSEDIARENWDLFENILCHCVLVEPACLPQVCDQLTHYRGLHFPISKPMWSDCLNRIVYERVPLGQSSEAAWAMWLMKFLNIKLLAKSAKTVGSCEDSIVGLMGLGLAAVGLAPLAHLSGLNRFSPSAGLFEEQWLLCYQGNLMEWLGPGSGRTALRGDSAFAFLESQSVSFFEIGVTPPPAARYPRPGTFVGGGGGGY